MKIFTVRDMKADYYMNPVTYKSTGEALRAFEQACKDKESQFNQFPSDFCLIELGEFDPSLGLITNHEVSKLLVTAADYAKKEE